MEKKKNKDPCAGCVWKLWTGTSEKVLCSLPVLYALLPRACAGNAADP